MGPDVKGSASGTSSSTESNVFAGEDPKLWEAWKEKIDLKVNKCGEGIMGVLWNWEPGDWVVDSNRNLTDEEAKEVVEEHYWYTVNSMQLPKRKLWEDPKNVVRNMERDRINFYALMMTMTSNRAKNEVRRLGVERAHELRSLFQRYYAKGTAERREELEQLVDDGFSNEQGRKMEDGDDLVEHIQGFENLLRELRELVPAEEIDSSKYSNPVEVSRCLAKGLPFKYISQLQVIKFITAGCVMVKWGRW